MKSTKKRLQAALSGALIALAAPALPAVALDLANAAFVQTLDGITSIPIGHAEFCAARPAECQPNRDVVAVMPLDEAHWSQLLGVNAQVNHDVVPVTDQQLYKVSEFWTYPNGYGDCEDFVLAKRRALIDAGWPASTLLMSVVRQANGEGHAVLLVRTDRGDFVLDNQDGQILLWSDTPYHFIKRQSQADAGQWVDMVDDRQIRVAAAN